MDIGKMLKAKKEEVRNLKRFQTWIHTNSVHRVLCGFLPTFLDDQSRRLRIVLDDSMQSRTDGRTITVSLSPDLMRDKYSSEDWLMMLETYAAHEAQHINSSNFKDIQEISVWYGKYLSGICGCPEKVGQTLGHDFLNIIEDGRIEAIAVRRRPGMLLPFRYSNEIMRNAAPIEEKADTPDMEYAHFHNTVLIYAKTGQYPIGIRHYKGTEMERIFTSTLHYIDEGVAAVTSEDCRKITEQFLIEITPYLVSLIASQELLNSLSQNTSDEYTSNNENQFGSGQGGSPQSGSGNPLRMRKSPSKGENGSGENAGEEKENTKDGRKASGKKQGKKKSSDESSGNGSGKANKSAESDKTGSDRKMSGGAMSKSDDPESSKDGTSNPQDSSASHSETDPDQTPLSSSIGDDKEGETPENSGSDGDGSEDDSNQGTKDEKGGETTDADSDADPDTDPDTGSDADPDPDSDPDADPNANPDTNSDTNSGSDSDVDPNPDPKSDSESPMGFSEEEPENNPLSESALDEVRKMMERDLSVANTTEIAEEQRTKSEILNTDGISIVQQHYTGTRYPLRQTVLDIPGTQAISPDMKNQAVSLRREMMRIKESRSRDRKGLRRGVVDTGALWKCGIGDDTIFTRKGQRDAGSVVFYLLMDNSGSMDNYVDGKHRKFEAARGAAAIIEEATSGIFPCKIALFNQSASAVNHIVIKGFDERGGANRSFNSLTAIGADGCNADSVNIRIASEELRRRAERKKILFVLSDGQPSAYCSKSDAVTEVKEAVTDARRKGIIVIPIMFGDTAFLSSQFPQYQGMYEKNIVACRPSEISQRLAALFRQVISR